MKEKTRQSIETFVAVALLVLLAVVCGVCSGCTSVITHYDAAGNVTKVEEVTNFSRVMDGTNEKSQMVLIDGTWASFEASATAGVNCTPGIAVKYATGNTALINERDAGDFSGASDTVEKFFAGEKKIGPDGITTR